MRVENQEGYVCEQKSVSDYMPICKPKLCTALTHPPPCPSSLSSPSFPSTPSYFHNSIWS